MQAFAALLDHSPLEGESQKPSRLQAKADAVGGRPVYAYR